MTRTLFVTHTPVWPVASGNSIRRSMIIRSLQRHGPVTLLQVPLGPGEPRQDPALAPVPVEVTTLGPRRRSPSTLVEDLALDRVPTELAGYRWRAVARQMAASVDLEGYDLVWTCRALGYLATRRVPLPIACDLDDLEDVKLERRLAVSAPVGLTRYRDWWRVRAWRALQDRCVTGVDTPVVCTEVDATRLARRSPEAARPAVVPNGVPTGVATQGDRPGTLPGIRPELLLLGLHTYGPNADGAVWFIRDVLPLVRARHPTVTVRIVGAAGDRIRRLAGDGIVVTGEVDDPAASFARATALVVPLRIGSGSRLKIIEAWARGIPVATTTIGAEGLDATDGQELLVGDGVEALAAACGRLVAEPSLRTALVAAGRDRYERFHSEPVIDAAVDAALDRLLLGVTR